MQIPISEVSLLAGEFSFSSVTKKILILLWIHFSFNENTINEKFGNYRNNGSFNSHSGKLFLYVTSLYIYSIHPILIIVTSSIPE